MIKMPLAGDKIYPRWSVPQKNADWVISWESIIFFSKFERIVCKKEKSF